MEKEKENYYYDPHLSIDLVNTPIKQQIKYIKEDEIKLHVWEETTNNEI